MWYEVLPSLAIIYLGLAATQYGTYYLSKIRHDGVAMRRARKGVWYLRMYYRDFALRGNVWTLAGLECIPDK